MRPKARPLSSLSPSRVIVGDFWTRHTAFPNLEPGCGIAFQGGTPTTQINFVERGETVLTQGFNYFGVWGIEIFWNVPFTSTASSNPDVG